MASASCAWALVTAGVTRDVRASVTSLMLVDAKPMLAVTAKMKVASQTTQTTSAVTRCPACQSPAAQEGMTRATSSAATPMARKSHPEHHLSLRPIGENDYSVIREGRAIGRIRLDDERPGQEKWEWAINPPLPVPPWGVGRAPSFEEAKIAFRAAWERVFLVRAKRR